MNGVLAHADSAEALLILLLAGHFLGDFLLQGWRAAAGRARAPFPARHVGIIIVAHIVPVIPFASSAVTGAVLGIGLLHAQRSRWKRHRHRRPRRAGAEYYLVGTLTSLLVAVVVGIVLGRLLV